MYSNFPQLDNRYLVASSFDNAGYASQLLESNKFALGTTLVFLFTFKLHELLNPIYSHRPLDLQPFGMFKLQEALSIALLFLLDNS